MAWLARLLGVSDALAWAGVAVMVLALSGVSFVSYKTGRAFGYSAGFSDGEDAQKAKQQAADATHRADVERKVRNALDEIGIDPSSSDAERILFDLLGPDAAE